MAFRCQVEGGGGVGRAGAAGRRGVVVCGGRGSGAVVVGGAGRSRCVCFCRWFRRRRAARLGAGSGRVLGRSGVAAGVWWWPAPGVTETG